MNMICGTCLHQEEHTDMGGPPCPRCGNYMIALDVYVGMGGVVEPPLPLEEVAPPQPLPTDEQRAAARAAAEPALKQALDEVHGLSHVLSYGGGVQSVAMCVLVARGILQRPDYIVCADTGREATSTWDYLTEVMQPYLARVGLRVDIASHDLSTVDLYSHKGDVLMPMHTATGQLRTYCSVEWKRRVVQRWLRQQGAQSVMMWIGFSLDERRRATLKPDTRWIDYRYPLLELNLTRQDCLNIIADAGLPEPPKSACWMCPHRRNSEWRHIRDNYPEDWQRAIELDEELRHAAPLETAHDDRIWLHRDRVPLKDADIDTPDKGENRQCGMGMCFV